MRRARRGSLSGEGEARLFCNRANVFCRLSVLLCSGEVLEHKRDLAKSAQFSQKRNVVQSAQSGANFVEMGSELLAEDYVFGVAAFDIRAELLEALAN